MANRGNGVYFYIDTYQEAVKIFERNLRSNLYTIAKDVKIQVEFNPDIVSEYRLIGYENRSLNREDFNNDKVDAGDVGQGHSVTALYEITYVGDLGKIEPARYSQPTKRNTNYSNEVAFVKLRFKPTDSNESQLMENKLYKKSIDFEQIDYNFKKAIMAASFAELLRESKYINSHFEYSNLIEMINNLKNSDRELAELRDVALLADALKRSSL